MFLCRQWQQHYLHYLGIISFFVSVIPFFILLQLIGQGQLQIVNNIIFITNWWITLSLFMVYFIIMWSLRFNKLVVTLGKIAVQSDVVIANPNSSRSEVTKSLTKESQDQMYEREDSMLAKNKNADTRYGHLSAINRYFLLNKKVMIPGIALTICIIVLSIILFSYEK